MDKFGTPMYEDKTIADKPIKYEFNMLAQSVHIHANFAYRATPDPTPTLTPAWKKGNVNLDGYVNAKAATEILKISVGLA